MEEPFGGQVGKQSYRCGNKDYIDPYELFLQEFKLFWP